MTDQIITEYDFDKTRLLVQSEETDDYEWVQADLIICADGIKSRARAAMYKRLGLVDDGG
jgi:salicylate hydroxylase